MKVVVYGDDSHGALPSSASQGTNIVFLTGNGRSAPVTWQSKKLDQVTRSSLASEVMSVADEADSGFMMASIAKELYGMEKLPVIELCTDSKSLKEYLGTKKVIQDPCLRGGGRSATLVCPNLTIIGPTRTMKNKVLTINDKIFGPTLVRVVGLAPQALCLWVDTACLREMVEIHTVG